MRLFDTHCHLDFAPFESDVEQHIQLAQQAGVERLLLPATGRENWSRLESLSQQFSSLYYAMGFHPYFLAQQSLGDIAILDAKIATRDSRCVAIGECGLDAMVDVPMALQEAFFIAQVELAQQAQLPLILHGRKTHNRLIQLLKQSRFAYGGILHGFSGSYQQAKQFVDLGFYLGVGGVITYPRANKTRQAVAQLPLSSLVLETDAPDMPLMGYQGESNHPKRLPLILEQLAQLQKKDRQTVANNVWYNSNLALKICE
ncbi:putative deoxyribonuclease YjjV [Vibrio ichthyoenteri ATCC 700023]|uniref:Putative deoxyribonuclease YjjV n=1 Tax=Vibrio ichthyoenteri ATCC 700023 TaxID=870968 RepID=F9RWW5_9VIBR|nr:TatD family hydrolase [Vibrio ichthyoenteri]EGU48879.1 putative deoxyribonuclease YjjV [Vibrio ichthyoenteri ATCC 700023]